MPKVLKLFESVLNFSMFNKYAGIEKNRISRYIMIYRFIDIKCEKQGWNENIALMSSK